MKPTWIKEFESPGVEYRGAPFWAWNGDLNEDELRRQVRLMHRMGLGGFFMHSRIGLETPYLEEPWFNCIQACIEEAEKLGMKAWLYDEDRWPSGAAGGIVSKSHPEFRNMNLILSKRKSVEFSLKEEGFVAAFMVTLDGNKIVECRRLKRDRPLVMQEGQECWVFVTRRADPSDWFNGGTYLDTMDPKAVRAFIDTTHEPYKKRFKKYFGNVVPGFFTDEPYRGTGYLEGQSPCLPWTPKLPNVIRAKTGFEILDHLPELFHDRADAPISRARYLYYDFTTHLFVNSFGRQIGEWLEKEGLRHTGHVVEEDTLSSQTNAVGAAMRFYEHMQAPGMDLLTEHWRIYDVAKQLSSVARQCNKRWRLTETYGCTGWDFSFEGQKALGDWQAALGINFRCQHLAWYTMQGEAKRDYPASIFYQSPWWEHYRKVEDYFARLHVVLSHGQEVRDLLVIHPIESMWVTLNYKGRQGNPQVADMEKRIAGLRDRLLTEPLDFDYGDEEILSRLGKVRKTKGEVELQVGHATYKAVLVPQVCTIRSSTVDLLRSFQKAGGLVVFEGEIAKHVDALPSDAAVELAQACKKAETFEAVVNLLAPVVRRISVRDDKGKPCKATLYQLREDASAFYLFLCNTSDIPDPANPTGFDQIAVRDRFVAYPRVKIDGFTGCAGRPVELDTATGKLLATTSSKSGKGWCIETSLPRIGSRLFMVPKKAGALVLEKIRPLRTTKSVQAMRKPVSYQLTDHNVLVLDRAAWRFEKEAWQASTEVLEVDWKCREKLGVSGRHGSMKQPWARPIPEVVKKAVIELDYEFDVTVIPSGPILLGMERPETFCVTLNGNPVALEQSQGWWCDTSLRTAPLDVASLRVGKNRLHMSCQFSEQHSGLESVYVLGNFGVNVKGTSLAIGRLPASLKVGSWTEQGLPFYSGSIVYQIESDPAWKKGGRVFVRVPQFAGAAVRVLVDGEEQGIIAWEPYECEITNSVKAGGRTIGIEVLGHRRNSHGPLHHVKKWPDWTGPDEFRTWAGDRPRWFEGYQLVPCGLLQSPMIDIRK